MFLSEEELETLTGFRRKSKQIAQLKQMGVAFLINACGHPVVLRTNLEGRKESKAQSKPEWRPSWVEAQP